MAKKNQIRIDFEGNQFVLGIASNERIWKLCWEVNKSLNINLSTELQTLSRPSAPPEYSDYTTDSDFDFTMVENLDQSSRIPKVARQFRYWLIIKPKRDKSPDLADFMSRLKTSEQISMVVDLTALNQEKSFLP